MPRAQMADGTILDFPEGTPDAVIDRAVQEYIAEQKAQAPQEPEETGITGALASGLSAAVRRVAGEAPTEGKTLAEQPMKFGDILHPYELAQKAAYSLAASSPEMAGAIGGGTAATMIAPEGGPLSTAVGAGVGAGAVNMATSIAPNFAEELKKTPDDPDGAFTRAVGKAGKEGMETGASFALFEFKPFAGAVKNLLFQAFAVQPGVHAVGQATTNIAEGKPVTEGITPESYEESVMGTIVPAAGMELTGAAIGKLRGKKAEPTGAVEDEIAEIETGETKPAETQPTTKFDEVAFNRLVDKYISEGKPEHEALRLAGERVHELTMPDTGEPVSELDVTRDGDRIPVPSGETGGERAAGEVSEPTAGGVGVSGRGAEPTGGTEGRGPSALEEEGIPSWQLEDARRHERELGVQEEGRELTDAELESLRPKIEEPKVEEPKAEEPKVEETRQAELELETQPAEPVVARAVPEKTAPETAPKVEEAAPAQEGLFRAEDTAESNKQVRENIFARLAEEKRKTEPVRQRLRESIRFLLDQGQLKADRARELLLEVDKQKPNFIKVNKELADAQSRAAEAELEPTGGRSIDEELAGGDNFNRFGEEEGRGRKRKPRYEEEGPEELSGDLRWRRGEEAAAGVNEADAQKTVSDLTAGWKNAPNVVIEKATDTTTKGYYNPETKTVHVVPENHTSPADLTATLHHESLAHHGLNEHFGAELENVMADIYRTNPTVKAEADAWLKRNTDADGATNRAARAAEEVLARRSESGPIKEAGVRAAFNKVIAFMRDYLRKNLGVVKTYTNNDVAHILRQAHQRVKTGTARNAPAAKGVRYSREEASVRKELDDIEEVQRRVEKSFTGTERNRTMGELFAKTRNVDDALKLLRAVYDKLDVQKLRAILPTMDTRDITRWIGDKVKNIKIVNKAMQDLVVERSRIIREVAEKVPEWVEFNRKFKEGGHKLEHIMATTTLSGVDPTRFTSRLEALAKDEKLQDLRKDRSKNKKDIKERETAINEIYDQWEALGKYDNGRGHRLYKMALDTYRARFEEHLDLLQKKIDNSGLSEDAKKTLRAAVDKRFKEARKLGVYFPLMRYGRYWYSTGKGKNLEFYMFESEVARNVAIADHVKELQTAGDKRSLKDRVADGDFDFGRHLDSKAFDKIGENDKLLKEIMDLIETNDLVDKNTLKDQVYQMYLMNLPEADPRKRMLPRQGVAGFATDQLRNFIVSGQTAATQFSRLKHADAVRNSIGQAYAELQGNPDKVKLKVFVDEIANRAGMELSPPKTEGFDWDKVASLGNKASFYWMLTSAKTAIAQMTQLPTVGLMNLVSKHGLAPTIKIATKYINPLYKTLGVTKEVIDPMTKETRVEWVGPTMKESDYINKNKDVELREALKDAYSYGEKQNLFMQTYAADMTSRARMPSETHGNVASRALRATANLMSGFFHHSERLSREVMYMSAFELEYKKAKSEGLPADQAKVRAQDAAIDSVYESLFDYSSYNKPRIMKMGALPKLATQFMTFPYMMTSYLVRNFYKMLPMLNKAEKKEAAIKFFGTLGMVGMFSGVSGMWGYSSVMGAADAARGLTRTDEDWGDDDENPLAARDMDLWFRTVFVPNHFGTGSSLAKALNLSEEQALMLQRGVIAGPISAATDLNIGSSVGLNDLFFKTDTASSSNKAAWQQFVFSHALGPFGNLTSQAFSAVDDFNNGDFEKGAEKLAPAFFRGAIKAARYAEEGKLNKNQAEIQSKEFYTVGKLAGQVAGFSSTEADVIDKENNLINKVAKGIEAERSEIMAKLDKAILQQASDPSEASDRAVDKVMEGIEKFNTKNGQLHAIKGDNVKQSIQNVVENNALALNGLVLNKKLAPYARELTERTRRQ